MWGRGEVGLPMEAPSEERGREHLTVKGLSLEERLEAKQVMSG